MIGEAEAEMNKRLCVWVHGTRECWETAEFYQRLRISKNLSKAK